MPYTGTTAGLLDLLKEKIYNRSPQAGIDRQTLKNLWEEAFTRQKTRNAFEGVDMTDTAAVLGKLKELSAIDPSTYAAPLMQGVLGEESRKRSVLQSATVANVLRGLAPGGLDRSKQAQYVASQVENQQEPEKLWQPNDVNYSVNTSRGRQAGVDSPEEFLNKLGQWAIEQGFTNEQSEKIVQSAIKSGGKVDWTVAGLPGNKQATKDQVDLAASNIVNTEAFRKLAEERGVKVPLTNAKGDVQLKLGLFKMMTPDIEGLLSEMSSPAFDLETVKDTNLRNSLELYRALRRSTEVLAGKRAGADALKDPFGR